MDIVKFRAKWLYDTGFDFIGQTLVTQFAEDYAKAETKELGMQIITKDGENQLLMEQIKELKEYTHHHQSCDSVGVYGKLDIECNCGLKQALKK
jgi:hypothetical protein